MQEESPDGLYGGFSAADFGLGYDIYAGGGFGSDLGGGFEKPSEVPPPLDPAGGEIIIRTDASARDGDEVKSTGTTNIVRATVYLGAGAGAYCACFQFQLPYGKDAMLSAATLVGYWTNRVAISKMMIYVEDADDAAVITAGAGTYDITGGSLVSSGGVPLGIPWEVEPGADGWVRSPDFAPLLQQVIGRSGWVKDQYVSVIVTDSLSQGD